MCEYLTWRYGRVFRTNPSAKAGFVMYDLVGLTTTTGSVDSRVTTLLGLTSGTPAIQKASSDLYNAYLTHDQEVLLADESQCAYDCKEFVLRTNLDLIASYGTLYNGITESLIMMDSNLDNPTAFMASTISCYVDDGTGTNTALFPVNNATIYFYDALLSDPDKSLNLLYWGSPTVTYVGPALGHSVSASSHWKWLTITPYVPNESGFDVYDTLAYEALSKAVDFYNIGIFVPVSRLSTSTNDLSTDLAGLVDVSAISIDAGSVSDVVIRNEQVFAFANLVNEDATSKATYKQVEKRVAADVANFVEHTDVATLAPTTPK